MRIGGKGRLTGSSKEVSGWSNRLEKLSVLPQFAKTPVHYKDVVMTKEVPGLHENLEKFMWSVVCLLVV